MTDLFQTVSLSIFSPLRCTPLSKSHRLFFIFGTLGRRVFQDPTLRKSGVAPIRSRPLVPYMGFLRDVAMSRQSKRACSALNFRNVIEIQPLRGCWKISLLLNKSLFFYSVGWFGFCKGTLFRCLPYASLRIGVITFLFLPLSALCSLFIRSVSGYRAKIERT